MPIRLEWYDPDETILLEIFDGQWDVNDFNRMLDQSRALLLAKDHIVHIILDFSASTSNPRNLLSGARAAERKMAHNQGVVIFVQSSPLIRAFVELSRRLKLKTVQHLYTVDSMQQALTTIAVKAADLPAQDSDV